MTYQVLIEIDTIQTSLSARNRLSCNILCGRSPAVRSRGDAYANNHRVPAVVSGGPGGSYTEVTGGALTLRRDHSYQLIVTIRAVESGRVYDYSKPNAEPLPSSGNQPIRRQAKHHESGAAPKFTENRLHQIDTARYFDRSTFAAIS